MTVFLYIFIACFLVQLFYYLFIFSKLALYHFEKPENPEEKFPVSVIICAKNEAENLKNFLPSILSQEYPEFEVIVVNDFSEDSTHEILQGFKTNHRKLKVIDLKEKKLPGKREALLTGIRAAQYEYLLLTDADCQPASSQWISSMMIPASEGKAIVLGYAPFFRQHGFLNRFIRFENFYTALQYLSFALAGTPYMGTGRNLLYHTSVLSGIKAFQKHGGLLSGDDDLTVNEIATGNNTTIMIAKEAHVFSMPKQTLSGWMFQKRRHLSTSVRYKFSHQVMLLVLNLSQIGFNVAFAAIAIYSVQLTLGLVLFVLKNIIQFIISGKVMSKLGQKDLMLFTPFGDMLMSVFFISLGMLSLVKVKKWK